MDVTQEDAPARKSRRKACDLCFKKKIRCDRTKPRCSHCKIYKEPECTFTPLKRVPANPKPASNSTHVDTLEAKLRELEARLKGIESIPPPGLPQGEAVPVTPLPEDLSLPAVAYHSSPESHGYTSSSNSSNDGPPRQGEGYPLPPLNEVLPWVSHYFATTNRIMPLFHEETFIRMLRDWYSTPISQQDPAVWAAINVVLALGRRHLYLDISSSQGTLDIYIRNAQSVLNHLITRDEDLLGIQVTLGLATIFYGTSDPKPAVVLLATACRLSHSLRLNTREFRNRGHEPQHADKDILLQRKRVFWVLYIHDRDISMRINQPAVLHEADIDIELPEENPTDGVGMLQAGNGTQLNYFRKRAQFAWIQGKVYEWLFSVRAEKLPPAQKEENTQRLERALTQWEASLPLEFRPENLSLVTDMTTFQTVMALHFSHMQTLSIIHRSYSYNAHWLETLRRQSGRMVEESSNEDLKALLPSGWNNMVQRSRSCLVLFSYLPEHNLYLVWMSCCAFFSSLIFLVVNAMVDPHHPFVEQDAQLTTFGLKVVTKLAEESDNDRVRGMLHAFAELESKARVIVERERARHNFGDMDFTSDDVMGLFLPHDGLDYAQEDIDLFGTLQPLDTGFGAEVEVQLLDVDEQPTYAHRGENPDFNGVVGEMLKQRWF